MVKFKLAICAVLSLAAACGAKKKAAGSASHASAATGSAHGTDAAKFYITGKAGFKITRNAGLNLAEASVNCRAKKIAKGLNGKRAEFFLGTSVGIDSVHGTYKLPVTPGVIKVSCEQLAADGKIAKTKTAVFHARQPKRQKLGMTSRPGKSKANKTTRASLALADDEDEFSSAPVPMLPLSDTSNAISEIIDALSDAQVDVTAPDLNMALVMRLGISLAKLESGSDQSLPNAAAAFAKSYIDEMARQVAQLTAPHDYSIRNQVCAGGLSPDGVILATPPEDILSALSMADSAEQNQPQSDGFDLSFLALEGAQAAASLPAELRLEAAESARVSDASASLLDRLGLAGGDYVVDLATLTAIRAGLSVLIDSANQRSQPMAGDASVSGQFLKGIDQANADGKPFLGVVADLLNHIAQSILALPVEGQNSFAAKVFVASQGSSVDDLSAARDPSQADVDSILALLKDAGGCAPTLDDSGTAICTPPSGGAADADVPPPSEAISAG